MATAGSKDAAKSAALVVIGNFDGVHRGHQAVLHAVAEEATRRQLTPRLFTFEPHPAETLGRTPPPRLTSLPRKKELAARHCPGIDVVVRPFTLAFAQQSPGEFVERILVAELRSRAVMVGRNFRFGKGRSGGIEELTELGAQHGFDVMAEPLLCDPQGSAWSSTRVRGLVAAGALDEAAAQLGRPHMLSGVVQRGAQRGRTIGFPTCNVGAVEEALPPFGVYAVLVDRQTPTGPQRLGQGVANLGVRPSLNEERAAPLLEVHLFDLNEDLYGERLRMHLLARLRDERRFAGLEALKQQIQRDAEEARALLASHRPNPERPSWF